MVTRAALNVKSWFSQSSRFAFKPRVLFHYGTAIPSSAHQVSCVTAVWPLVSWCYMDGILRFILHACRPGSTRILHFS